MSGEKNETYILTGFLCSISEVLSYRVREPVNDFGYSMFGLGYGWRHVIMYAG